MKRMNKGRDLSVAIAISVAMVLLVWWTQGNRSHTSDDFSDLRVERKALPDEKNFRIVLDEAAGLLPGRVNAPQWLLTAKALGNKWEADAATNILAQSEEARARIKAGLNQCEGYSNDEPIKMTTGYLGSICDNADQRLALAWAMRVSFEHAVQTGDAERAYGLVCDMFRAVSLMAESPGGLADLKHMMAWLACGMMCCEKLAHQAACRDEWLAEMQERMPKRSEIVKAGAAALRSEFNRLYPFTLRFSTWDKLCYPTCNELVLRMQKRYWFFMDLTYRPEQTRRLLAESFRDAIAIVQSERVATPLDEKSAFKTKSASAYFRPNVGGRIMNESVTFFNVSFVRRLKGLEAREECLRAVLACERDRRKAGAYPETLDVLVPEYLFRAESEDKALDLVYPVSSNQCATALEAARRWHARGHSKE